MDLRVDTGTVYDIPYHTVQPYFGGASWMDMEVWCTRTFGKTSLDGVWTPGRRWYMNNSKFWFRDQRDLTMFILRWA
jgi:hypothetical protein